MRSRRRVVATLLVTGTMVGFAGSAFAEPPKGQGYFKNVNGGGAGASECSGPHQSQLPTGQAKKC